MKRLSVLGSTGSIGTQTLDVCRNLGYSVVALAAGSNAELLEKQAREFRPKIVALYDENAAKGLSIALSDTDITVLGGEEGVLKAAAIDCDIVLNAVTGIAGPDGGSAEKPVGLVYIGCCVKEKTVVERNIFKGSRRQVREQSVMAALALLKKQLQ